LSGNTDVRQVTALIVASTLTEPKPRGLPKACALISADSSSGTVTKYQRPAASEPFQIPSAGSWSARPNEKESAQGALLLAPVPRPAIYVGKLLGIVALLVAIEAVLLPLVAFLFTARLFAHPFWLAGIVLTCTVGLASVGTLFAAMLVRARSRDMLLPVLLYPVVVPVIIAGVQGTAALLQPTVEIALVRFWLLLLVTFDVVFVVLALWTFEAVMSD